MNSTNGIVWLAVQFKHVSAFYRWIAECNYTYSYDFEHMHDSNGTLKDFYIPPLATVHQYIDNILYVRTYTQEAKVMIKLMFDEKLDGNILVFNFSPSLS